VYVCGQVQDIEINHLPHMPPTPRHDHDMPPSPWHGMTYDNNKQTGCLLLAGASATRSNGLLNCLPLALSPAITEPLLGSLLRRKAARASKRSACLWSWAFVRELVLRGLGSLLVLAPYAALQARNGV
jgi:hypothetical protein